MIVFLMIMFTCRPMLLCVVELKLGEGTHIGAGATIIPGITIGRWVTVGAGAVIIKDVPDNVTIVGNPGKIVKIAKENEG